MELPKDPMVLFSVINMKLRDCYSSLDELCEDMDVSREDIVGSNSWILCFDAVFLFLVCQCHISSFLLINVKSALVHLTSFLFGVLITKAQK